MDGLQRGSAAIVGVAESDLGAVAAGHERDRPDGPGHPAGARRLRPRLRDVDGLLCATAQSRTSGLSLAEYLGISPAFIDSTILGGSSFMFHVAHAQAALQLGLCKVAVIAYGSTQRTIGRRHASVREYNPYETPFRPFLPSTAYALAASRHIHQYGTTREQLAAVAVAAREWALLNPAAWEKKPLTVAEVLAARMISYPFTVRDICLVTDGGGAVVMTTAEERAIPEKAAGLRPRLRSSDHPRQHFEHAGSDRDRALCNRAAPRTRWRDWGPATSTCSNSMTRSRSIRSSFSRISASAQRARAAPSWPTAASRRSGSLPVNTNGGGLSYCHPGMYGLFLLIEATRQLRGECGARQIADCETAIAHGNGGVLSSQSTVILGTAATL